MNKKKENQKRGRSGCLAIIAVVVLFVVASTLFGGSSSTGNPLMDADFETAAVMNGTGTNKIGERAYIQIEKKELTEITEEQYAEFCAERVDNSGYNWVTIIASDGTGITFAGSNSEIAEYGQVDAEGCITTAIGFINRKGEGFIYEPK